MLDGRQLAHLLTDPTRLKSFSAVALGASTDEAIAQVAGLSPQDATRTRKRLQDAGVIVDGDRGGTRACALRARGPAPQRARQAR